MKELLETIKPYFLANSVLDKRYDHSIGVMNKALELNKHLNLGLNEDKIIQSALLHDIAKMLPKEEQVLILKKHYNKIFDEIVNFPSVWHSFCGKVVAMNDFNITDFEVLDAICFHTTGRPNMSVLEKLIFICDYIEDSRTGLVFEEARKIAFINLDDALIKILSETIKYLESNSFDVYYLTKETYQYYFKERKIDV